MKSFFKTFAILVLGVMLLAGCAAQQAMLDKQQEERQAAIDLQIQNAKDKADAIKAKKAAAEAAATIIPTDNEDADAATETQAGTKAQQNNNQTTPATTQATQTQTAPAQTVPAQTAPAQTVPAQTAPAQTAPAQSAPAHTSPAHTAPAQTAPVQTAPAQTAPAKTTPALTVPAQTTPTQAAPAQTLTPTAPVKTAPAPTAPTQAPPTQTTPSSTVPASSTSAPTSLNHVVPMKTVPAKPSLAQSNIKQVAANPQTPRYVSYNHPLPSDPELEQVATNLKPAHLKQAEHSTRVAAVKQNSKQAQLIAKLEIKKLVHQVLLEQAALSKPKKPIKQSAHADIKKPLPPKPVMVTALRKPTRQAVAVVKKSSPQQVGMIETRDIAKPWTNESEPFHFSSLLRRNTVGEPAAAQSMVRTTPTAVAQMKTAKPVNAANNKASVTTAEIKKPAKPIAVAQTKQTSTTATTTKKSAAIAKTKAPRPAVAENKSIVKKKQKQLAKSSFENSLAASINTSA